MKTQFANKTFPNARPSSRVAESLVEQGAIVLTEVELAEVSAAGAKPGICGGANRESR